MRRPSRVRRKTKRVTEGLGWLELPLLPLRDVVVFPGMVVPLFVGRSKSVSALDEAMQADKQLLMTTQRSVDCDDPEQKDLYKIGTLASILQLLKLPDGSVKVLVEGTSRQRIHQVTTVGGALQGFSESLEESPIEGPEVEALMRHSQGQLEAYVRLNRKIPQETLVSIVNLTDAGRLADNIGNRPTFIISYVATALVLTWGLFTRDLWGLYLFALVFGFGWGAQAVLRFAVTSEVFGTTSLGTVMGIFGISESVASAIGAYYAGYIFDIIGSYHPAFWTGIVLAILGIILTSFLKPARRKNVPAA